MGTDRQISSELSRELTLFHITMMGLGMMIGAGVFLGVGNAIHYVGPGGAILTFALNGIIALFTAMSYGELSSAIPRAGGAYNFARIGFGRGTSFIAGWMEWFASSVAGSIYALTFSIYTLRFFAHFGSFGWLNEHMDIAIKISALFVAVFFLYVNYRGASETGKVGAFFTLGQTVFLAFIGIIGILVTLRDPSRLSNFKPFMPHGWTKLLMTMGFTYVAFEGFEVISQAGDEAVDARRNLPKAMIYSVFVVTLTYVAVAFATVVSVKAGSPGVDQAPWEWIGQFRERGFGEAVSRLIPQGNVGNVLLTMAVIFASTSALNATIYSATRACYALGRDRMLPSALASISKKRKTPWVALLGTGGILVAVALFLPTIDVAASASIMFLFLFFLVNFCVIKIRRHMSDELKYGFVMPFFPLFPIAAILAQAFLAVWLIHMSPIAWIVAPLWIFSGLAVFHLYAKRHVEPEGHEVFVLKEEKSPEVQGYRIMVALANPQNALELVRNTYKICNAKDGSVELLHMVPVPDQVPLKDAELYMGEGREAILESMLYLLPLFPVSTTFRYCRNVARGIVSAVREKKANMLIMGWHGEHPERIFRLGSKVDPIIEQSPCNVVIFKECNKSSFQRILVPLSGGPNGQLSLETAGILLDQQVGEIVPFTVNTDRRSFDVEKFLDTCRDLEHVPWNRLRPKTIESKNVVHSILQEAEDYDLIVIGATREPWLRQVYHLTIPEAIARDCQRPLVMVKAAAGLGSWLNRWV